jgi:hypothetical protein
MADETTTQPTIEESITALQTSNTNILARLTKLEIEVAAIPTTTTDPAVTALTEKFTNLGDALDRHGIR